MSQFNAEFIERLLEGKLSDEEIKMLESAVKQSPELKQEIELQEKLVKRIMQNALKQSVKDAQIRFEKRKVLMKKIWIWSVVVGAVVLLCLAYLIIDESEKKESISGAIPQFKQPEAARERNTVSVADTILSAPDTVLNAAVNKAVKNADHFTEPADVPMEEANIKVAFSSYEFAAEKGIRVKDKRSGTEIVIPGRILTDKNGKMVTGKVNLRYREFRQVSDFVLAGYPMTFKGKNFNSAGMFEILVVQKDDTLQIKKERTVDVKFKMTESADGIGFYNLDKKKKKWDFIRSVRYRIGVFGATYEEDDSVLIATTTESVDKLTPAEQRALKSAAENMFRRPLDGQYKNDPIKEVRIEEFEIPAGHDIDPLVADLKLTGFGVFNCDQVYRIKNPVNVRASYVDEKMEKITNLRVVNVIDKKVNGAFSFDPHNFTCSREGTMLVLFTRDHRIYHLNENAWNRARLTNSGPFVFKMKEVTSEVKSSDDLQKILNLKSEYGYGKN